MRSTILETDFCIAGGGMSGVCAALAAARNGARVVLLQDRSVPGGNASSEVRMHICGASCSGKRPGARESGIIDELRVEDAVRNPRRSPHLFDLLLYDRIVSEPNITLLLDTTATGCEISQGRILSAGAVRHSTEDEFTIRARYFADCTGDGRLGLEAGADFRMGREARAEYGEPLAPERADGSVLGSSILFQARRREHPVAFAAPAWARKFSERALRLRSHAELGFGYWWVEWGGHLDTIADNAAIRHELLRIALGVWDHIKNHCARRPQIDAAAYDKTAEGAEEAWADAANWELDWIGFLPGKRESRRFLGPHVLTQSDIQAGRIFEDQVAYGGWYIDTHPTLGVDAVEEYPCAHHPVPHLYSIPLRCLYSRNVGNLFFAGRNASATHVAFASTRVMATCALMGQAIGTAAAYAVRTGAAELASAPHIGAIQQMLLRDGAFLIGLRNEDPDDLARSARVSASSGEPRALQSGIGRRTRPELHPALPDASNCWAPAELPAWIEVAWEKPCRIAEVRLVFDTGLERELTLSMNDEFSARMVRGPQPETVRHYRVEYLAAGGEGLRPVAEVHDNYQGLRVHRLAEPVSARALRVTVEATHGAAAARVFAVRVYGPAARRVDPAP
jgi:hypothetical protein